MAMHSLTLFCYRCEIGTGHTKPVANHVLHLILTVLSGGLWLPVWLYATIAGALPAMCSRCGAKYDEARAAETAWRIDHARRMSAQRAASASYQHGAYNPFPFSLPPSPQR